MNALQHRGEDILASDTALPALSSPSAKLVYLGLCVNPGVTVDELSDALGMRRLNLFGVLDSLQEQGLVRRDGPRFVPAS